MRRIALPEPTPLSEPFWAAVREHRLTIPRCVACGHWEWTPQMACGRCLGETLAWAPVSGRGSVYTFSIVRRPQSEGFEAPYVVAVVELEEGIRMMANVTGVAPEAVSIGMPVEVGFEDFERITLYHFQPAS